MFRQNKVLQNSNKRMHKELSISKNVKRKNVRGLSNIFSKNMTKACDTNVNKKLWRPEAVRQALILKVKCGSSGYNEVRKHFSIPSLRTLQRRIEHIEFRPGIFEEVFNYLANEIPHHREEWKDCVIAFDEMSIEPRVMFDPSIKEFIGRATLSSHSGIANKALLFVLRGVTFKWKQSVCFHLTSSKANDAKDGATGQAYSNIIRNIIEHSEKIGLRVHCIVSDMGSDNRSMWKTFGITASRFEVKCSIPHPIRPSCRLYIMADVPHLFKAIRSMIINNKIVYLPQDIVEYNNLPSNEVKFTHFEELLNSEATLELKVAFRLKKENLGKSHFNGMKVATAKSIFCNRTASGLQLLAFTKGDPSYVTTAWFVSLINRWFELMTSRRHVVALSK
ncbi:PREDICTED: uncharacterized protein LOC105556508, partial [Vollenhovia emeryi]|uniref:uncharacterized protein LOC105556508 n=1 Tax=Vollenhovia emeryi TaxID=411798 RepID=UPI0005F533B8